VVKRNKRRRRWRETKGEVVERNRTMIEVVTGGWGEEEKGRFNQKCRIG